MRHRCPALIATLLLISAAAVIAANANRQNDIPKYAVVAAWPQLPPNIQIAEAPGVAVDKNDNVYLFHRGKNPILVFNSNGRFLRTWGNGLFKTAHGLRIDRQGNIWTTDLGNHLVRKFTPEGKLLMTLGTKDSPGVGNNQFNKPADVVLAPDGHIYVADGYGNNRIVKFSKDGKYIKEWGKKGIGRSEFNLPHGVLIHKGNIVVADRENDRVQIFTPEGKFLAMWKKPGAPFGLIRLGQKHWLLADGRADLVNVLNIDGDVVGRFGMKGMNAGEFNLPHGICADSKGAVYVAEIKGKRVQKFVAN